ncbi:hypothetical protein K443DRAFT_542938 [Laccaria amethystina LaAM-08-1]|uniref:Uncharacterized protein n=1 Tax=Laccaria amethystina LaAM-08-1 TaxID=1095629 RepID=A0A0C9WT22_9AGAR|nr:hypothetical protein K443DRAFT_542938 [Laccaria amethystina LaAM-08-1]
MCGSPSQNLNLCVLSRKTEHHPLPASRHARGGRARQCSPCENERVGQLMSGARSTECNLRRFGVTLRRRPRPEINSPLASKRRSRIHVRSFSVGRARVHPVLGIPQDLHCTILVGCHNKLRVCITSETRTAGRGCCELFSSRAQGPMDHD